MTSKNICRDDSHKQNVNVMYCFEHDHCGCPQGLKGIKYIKPDGTIDADMYAEASVDAYRRFRKERGIEYYRNDKRS